MQGCTREKGQYWSDNFHFFLQKLSKTFKTFQNFSKLFKNVSKYFSNLAGKSMEFGDETTMVGVRIVCIRYI